MAKRVAKRRILATAVAMSAAAGGTVALTATQGSAETVVASATLRNPAGQRVGWFRIVDVGGGRTRVRTGVDIPGATEEFHGFHIHANDDPSNGEGCIADATQPSTTWFVAVDGHFNPTGAVHGHHAGDMPSILVGMSGHAQQAFDFDKAAITTLAGRAVILHAGPDNFGNIPLGTAADQYTANSTAATDKTSKTGNAGDRIACGLITLG